MSSKALKAIAPLNDSVCRALEMCEQFDASADYADRMRFQEEAKDYLFRRIPQDPHYAAFVNKRSDFYKTYLELREIVKRNDVTLLEERFQKLRRGSQVSTLSRPSFSGSPPYPVSPKSGGKAGLQMPEPNGHAAASNTGKHSAAVSSTSNDNVFSMDDISSVPNHDAPSERVSDTVIDNENGPTYRAPNRIDGAANDVAGIPSIRAVNGAAGTIPNGYQASNGMDAHDSHGKSKSRSPPVGQYEISPSIVRNKISVSKVLMIDIRLRDEFDEGHVMCPLIACIEPGSLKPIMSEADLEDALVISAASEFDSFAMRDQVDMIVLYDNDCTRAADSPAVTTVYNALVEAGRRPYVMKGGFDAWKALFPDEIKYSCSPSSVPSYLESPTPPMHPEPPIHKMFPHPASSRPTPPAIPPKETISSRGPATKTVSQPLYQSPYSHSQGSLNHTSTYSASSLPSTSEASSMSLAHSNDGYAPSGSTTKYRGYNQVPHRDRPAKFYQPMPSPPTQPAPEIPNHSVNSLASTGSSPAHQNTASSRSRPDYSRSLSGYADTPAKMTLPSLRVPKLSLNGSLRHHSLSPTPSPGKDYSQRETEARRSKASSPVPVSASMRPYARAAMSAPSSEHSSSASTLRHFSAEPVNPRLLSTTGLKNMGNTCYMNCILQCLLGVTQLIEPFLDGSYVQYINFKSRLGYKGQFAHVFANLVKSMTEHQGGYVAPIEIKNFSGQLRPDSFGGYDQQDCQEFLTFILDGLHEDLNSNGDRQKQGELDPKAEEHREAMGIRVASAIEWERYLKGDTSLIVDLFQGQYLSRLQCMTCKRTSTTYNAFSSLSLPIASPKLLGQQTSLKTCFDEFVKPELLDGDNAWFCPHCQKKRRTVKTLQISRLPLILVIHLKRFKRSSLHGVNKLETPVDYPVHNLDLTRYWPQLRQGEFSHKEAEMLQQIPSRGQTPPFVYDLCAVTLHHGSLKSGHYTAVVQKPGYGWLYYDDANVYSVKEQAAISRQAYVLFYKRSL